MQLVKLQFKNVNSYGNKIQTIEFSKDPELIMMAGSNGIGKCLHPDSEIYIEFVNKELEKKFRKFIENKLSI